MIPNKHNVANPSRRRALQSAVALAAAFASSKSIAQDQRKTGVVEKRIPISDEPIAPIGMGTWITFNVGDDPAALAQRAKVLSAFFESGGGMIDSSPMYGSAQQVLGQLLTPLAPERLFSATKVWIDSDGRDQIAQAHQLWKRDQFDLLQVHNLVNWRNHLALLQEMKQQGTIRYLGISTSHGRRHREMEKIIRQHPLDFVQLTYNAVDREVEQRLLPLAQEKGVAVIANRPFQRGALPQRLSGTVLPPIAAELDCNTWAELLLKFIISHPAITCAIPATSRVDHMLENMRSGTGPLPTDQQREQISQLVLKS